MLLKIILVISIRARVTVPANYQPFVEVYFKISTQLAIILRSIIDWFRFPCSHLVIIVTENKLKQFIHVRIDPMKRLTLFL